MQPTDKLTVYLAALAVLLVMNLIAFFSMLIDKR